MKELDWDAMAPSDLTNNSSGLLLLQNIQRATSANTDDSWFVLKPFCSLACRQTVQMIRLPFACRNSGAI